MKIFVTYGYGSRRRSCFSVVEGPKEQDIRAEIRAATQGQYAFTYTEAQFEGQADKYGLLECELGPQTEPPVYCDPALNGPRPTLHLPTKESNHAD